MNSASGNCHDAERVDSPRVAITGATGFIGRYVVQLALARGWQTLALGRGPCPLPTPPGLRYRELPDCSAPTLPRDWIGRPFTLVHLAWDTSRAPRFAIHAQQAQRLVELVETYRDLGLTHVVGLGSAEEFGVADGTISADDPPHGPLSPYGLGKRMAGELLAAWSARAGATAWWLCPMLVYGPGQSGNMVLPYALRQAMCGAAAQFSDGRQRRDLVYVEDVAAAIVAAVERPPIGFRRAMLGTGRAVAVCEAILEIARHFAAEDRFELGAIARRAGEPAVQQADVRAAGEGLGWQATTDWRSGVARLCRTAQEEPARAALLGQAPATTWLPHVPQPGPPISHAAIAPPHLPLNMAVNSVVP